ncbi:MAG: hypothetical protein ACQESH_08635 [Campylobacterota bacterium]
MRWLFAAIVLLFLSGCEIDAQKAQLVQERTQQEVQKDEAAQKSQEVDQKELLQLQHQAALELEKLRSQNALQQQKLELEANQQELQMRKQLAQSENEIAVQTHQENLAFYKLALIVLAVAAVIIIFIFYLINKKNRETKQKMQEDKLKAEYELKQQEFYHQRVNKLLEIASSKESDEQVKKDALKMLKNDHTLKRLDYNND